MAVLPSTCGPSGVWESLVNSGFSTVQAIGAMANAIAESTLNPESSVIDSNGARSNGLWQFNEATYPDSGKLVTGNCKQDIAAQVDYLKSHVSGNALAGNTGAEVAGNFAANFERCQGCTSGDTTTQNGWGQRVKNAATVEGWVSSGKWPAGGAGIPGGGSGGGGGTQTATLAVNNSRCLIGRNTFVPCLLYASQARAIIGGLMLGLGGLLGLGGALVIVAVGAQRSGVASAIPGPAGVAVRSASSGGGGSRSRAPRAPSAPAASSAPPARQPTARAYTGRHRAS